MLKEFYTKHVNKFKEKNIVLVFEKPKTKEEKRKELEEECWGDDDKKKLEFKLFKNKIERKSSMDFPTLDLKPK